MTYDEIHITWISELHRLESEMVPVRSALAREDDEETADQLQIDLNELEIAHDNVSAALNLLDRTQNGKVIS